MSMPSRFIDAPAGRLHFKASVDPARVEGPAAVLVHGVGLSHRYMMPLAQTLARDLPVFVPDLPGFGLSSKPREILDLDRLADAIAELMEGAGLEGAGLVGNSFGCQLIVRLAVRRPALVGCAVLQGMTVEPARRTWLGQFIGWRLNQREESSPQKKHITRLDYRQAGYPRTIATFRHALLDRPEDALPRIDRPALVVRGSRDPIISQAWAEQQAELLPRGRLEVLEGLSHTINFTAPEPLAQVATPFLLRHAHVGTRGQISTRMR